MDRFCRTCLHIIPRDSMFFQLDGQDLSSVAMLIRSQLQTCVPEVRVGVIKNAVLCNPCLNDLTSAYKFKRRCLETEKQVLEYILHADPNTTHVDINLLVKRISNNSIRTRKYKNDLHSQSPSFLRPRFHRTKYLSSKRCEAKYKKEPEDCTINITVGNGENMKKRFINDGSTGKFIIENNLARLMSSDVKVVGPLSKFLSVDDISSPIMNGIEKKPIKFPQINMETVFGQCIDINDSDEEFDDMVLPKTHDVSIPSSSMNDSQVNVEESDLLSQDDEIFKGFKTIALNGQNHADIVKFETANPPCDNGHIPLIKPEKKECSNFRSSTKRKCFKSCSSKNIKKKNDNHIETNNLDSKNSSLINTPSKIESTVITNSAESAKLIEIANLNNKNSPLTSTATESIVVPNSRESAKQSKITNVHNKNASLINISPTIESFVIADPTKPVKSIDNRNITVNVLPSNSLGSSCLVTETNNSALVKKDIVIKDSPSSDTSTLKNELTSPEKCSHNVTIKEECATTDLSAVEKCGIIEIKDEVIISEPSTVEECRAIEIKDEVIIKDECEFQHHKTQNQEMHSSYPVAGSADENDDNTMETEGLQLSSVGAYVSQPDKLSSVLNRALDDDFNSEPSYREARKGRYSCAVCSYSCNSERILVAHTEVHTNKKYDEYDDVIFCGFTREDFERTGCSRCKYAKSESFLMWLKPEVVLLKCKTE